MPKRSAGILIFRRTGAALELLLVHPGGPFWARKDLGAWSIPKGEYEEGQDPLAAARRECTEELGCDLAAVGRGELHPLGEVRQAGGKIVTGFALEGDLDAGAIRSNSFEMEWPPRSGRRQSFPEIDRAQWFTAEEARLRILPGQRELIDRLLARLAAKG